MSLFSFITFIDGDAVMHEIDHVHDPDVWISAISVATRFSCLLVAFLVFLGNTPDFVIARCNSAKIYLWCCINGGYLGKQRELSDGGFLSIFIKI